jgi:hypothetical protein
MMLDIFIYAFNKIIIELEDDEAMTNLCAPIFCFRRPYEHIFHG